MVRQTIRLMSACLFFMATLVACTASVDEYDPAMTRYVLEHDGLEREYFVFLPSNYDAEEKLPVGVFLHGYGGTATGTEAEVTQGLNVYAEKFGYVMVYPQGTWFMAGDSPETQWEATTWNHISDGFDKGPEGPICTADAEIYPCPPECGACGSCGWTSCNDDTGFLKALVATVASDFAVDDKRFYVSGFSNGAMMAQRIGCEASDLFAAVALVGARVEPGFECAPTNKLPLMQINGGKDRVVPHDGSASDDGYFFANTRAVTAEWLNGEACATAPERWSTPTIDDEAVQCSIACGATDHAAIDCIWPEGDHRWPGTSGFIGSNGYCVTELQSASMPDQLICIAPDPDAELWGSQLIFEFFDKH